jgi:hypothetical protein
MFGTASFAPISLNCIHQIIASTVWFPNRHVAVAELVLAQNGFDLIGIDIRKWYGVGDSDPLPIMR